MLLGQCIDRRGDTRMRSRSDIDIMAEVLHAASERSGAGRTKIMYRAFLSYAQLKKYLPALTEPGLLSYDIDIQTFKTTEKGLRFLDTYYQIYDAIKILPRAQQKQV